jgi:hypothetical protein
LPEQIREFLQVVAAGVWHFPALHVPAATDMLGLLESHLPSPQLEVGYSQAKSDLPVQLPPQLLPSLVHLSRLLCGAPEGTVEQVPCLPLISHAWHWPEQAPSQQ